MEDYVKLPLRTGKITTDGDTGHSLECSMAHAYGILG